MGGRAPPLELQQSARTLRISRDLAALFACRYETDLLYVIGQTRERRARHECVARGRAKAGRWHGAAGRAVARSMVVLPIRAGTALCTHRPSHERPHAEDLSPTPCPKQVAWPCPLGDVALDVALNFRILGRQPRPRGWRVGVLLGRLLWPNRRQCSDRLPGRRRELADRRNHRHRHRWRRRWDRRKGLHLGNRHRRRKRGLATDAHGRAHRASLYGQQPRPP